jgi:hypothetical protein
MGEKTKTQMERTELGDMETNIKARRHVKVWVACCVRVVFVSRFFDKQKKKKKKKTGGRGRRTRNEVLRASSQYL